MFRDYSDVTNVQKLTNTIRNVQKSSVMAM